MKCSKCGAELVENAMFCMHCGTKVEAESLNAATPTPGQVPVQQPAQTPAQHPVQAAPAQTAPAAPSYTAPVYPAAPAVSPKSKAKGGKGKKAVIIAIIAVLAAAIVAAGIFLVLKSKGSKAADNPLVYTTKTDLVVIDRLADSKDKCKTISISDNFAGHYFISDDNKYIIYAENLNEEEKTFDVYYKKIAEDAEAVQLAKNVTVINAVIGSVDKVIYTKNDCIYYADSEGNSTKLAKDQIYYEITEDKNYILTYKENLGSSDDEDESYAPSTFDFQYINLTTGEEIQICKEASRAAASDSYDTFYYIKSEKLYVSGISGKSTQIATDVDSMIITSNHLFYTTTSEKYSLYDFVKDDYKDADSKLKDPNWKDYKPEEPKEESYKSDEAFEKAYDKYIEAYKKAEKKYYDDLEKYEAAADRIELREEIKESEITFKSYTLYSYDGKESKKVADNVSYIYGVYNLTSTLTDYSYADAATVRSLKTPYKDIKKISLTDIDNAYDVTSYLYDNIEYTASIATANGIIDVERKDLSIQSIYCLNDNYIIAYYDKDADDMAYQLYSLPLTAKDISTSTQIAKNVYSFAYPNGKLAEFTDYDQEAVTSTLTIDGKKMSDVFPGWLLTVGDDGFYYATEPDTDTYQSTVYCYSNGESKKIADDLIFVDRYFAKEGDNYLAITDFNVKDLTGSLICVTSEGSYEIDSDVGFVSNDKTKLIPSMTANEMDEYYFDVFMDD